MHPQTQPRTQTQTQTRPQTINEQQQEPTSPRRSQFQRKQYDICIAGAGLSGAVLAERYASQQGKRVLVVEKRDHIGGNCYDYIDAETDIRVSKYGAHIFHTKSTRVWSYVQQFSGWTTYEHEVQGWVDGQHVPIPVNIDTVNRLFDLNISDSREMDEWLEKEREMPQHEGSPSNSEEMALSRVGRRLYDLIFHPYTVKQWNKQPNELGPEVTARIPVRNSHDPRYFDDPYQALPSDGYTAFFHNLLQHDNIEVHVNTDYFASIRDPSLSHDPDAIRCDMTYYTGPIDTYFASLGWPKLEYRSLDFERRVITDIGTANYFQPRSVINHPSLSDDYTRIVEYKHFLNQTTSPHTVLFYERSKDGGDPFYPVPNPRNRELYERYQRMAQQEDGVRFVGRLANYKYFNMDQAILNALTIFDEDSQGGGALPRRH